MLPARGRLIDTNMPRDKNLQAAVGRVAIRYGQLDHFLRWTIKSINSWAPEEAWAKTKNMTSKRLRDSVKTAALAKLGEGDALTRLEQLLAEAKGAAEERNKLMHALWAMGEDGEQKYWARGGCKAAAPTVSELDALAARLDAIAGSLNSARRRGFLREALESKQRQA